MFKPGDTVQCIDADQANGSLTRGQIYTVASSPPNVRFDNIWLVGNDQGWLNKRFRLLRSSEVRTAEDVRNEMQLKSDELKKLQDELAELEKPVPITVTKYVNVYSNYIGTFYSSRFFDTAEECKADPLGICLATAVPITFTYTTAKK